MKLEWYCAMCGKEGEKNFPVLEPLPLTEEIVEGEGWIVQHNSPYVDIYCSTKCAL